MPGRSYDRYGYPAGIAPGFNQQHFAATVNLRLSVVATGHKQVRQFFPGFGLATAIGSNSSATIDGPIGPAIIPWAYSEVRFTKPAQDRIGTCACIMFGPSSFDPFGAGFYHILSDCGFSGGGFQLAWGAASGNIFINAPNGGSPYGWYPATTITIPIRQPIFLAACYQESGPACFVLRNLATGQLFAQPSGANGGTLNTTAGAQSMWFLGGAAFNQAGGDEHYNCAMFSGDYLSLSALVKWSEDPWDFWYPRWINMRKQKGAAFVVQLLRPDADDSISDWTDQAGGTTTIFNSIDEVSASDADYIRSPTPPNTSVARFRMSDPTAGKTLADPVKVRYRFKKTSSDDQQLIVSLKQGAMLIKLWTHTGAGLTESFQTVEQTLSSGELASITDFNNLYIEFQASPP